MSCGFKMFFSYICCLLIVATIEGFKQSAWISNRKFIIRHDSCVRISMMKSSTSEKNPFPKIKQALDDEKNNLDHNFGSLFEQEVRKELLNAGYENLLDPEDGNAKNVNSMKVLSINGEDSEPAAEFDAVVYGNRKMFDEFSAQFLDSYKEFRPAEGDSHILMVEVKLNSGLLMEWIQGEVSRGNRRLFLNPNLKEVCKVVVINGGKESQLFIRNMRLKSPDKKFASTIQALKAAHINVFYKLWASGETFGDLFEEIKEIKEENREIKEENRDIKEENRDIKEENREIKLMYLSIQERLDTILQLPPSTKPMS